jgi:hypothetical protein
MNKPTIFDLMQAVRRHPDYVFGTAFVVGDFPDEIVPEDFDSGQAEDWLVQAGNEFIEFSVSSPD